MTTASLPLKVRRSRFVHHLWATLGVAVPEALYHWRWPPAGPVTAGGTAAREAQEVRKLAYAHSRTDPGFAADLYAAAARHEGLQGD